MSYLEQSFHLWVLNEGLPKPSQEFEFHPSRKWRFDFAWPGHKVAVEIEGVTKTGGRHQRRDGFIKDAEKYEAAMVLGWIVYRVPGCWVADRDRHVWRPAVIENLRRLLVNRGGI